MAIPDMLSDPPVLRTERLVLRQVTESDGEGLSGIVAAASPSAQLADPKPPAMHMVTAASRGNLTPALARSGLCRPAR